MQQIILLCPLYKDEASFQRFAAEIETAFSGFQDVRLSFVVVNDGTDDLHLTTRLPLTLLHLHRNVGHQKAITIGLAYVQAECEYDRIIIMDADGEDRPEDIKRLVQMDEGNRELIVVKRKRRQEGKSFRLFYLIYKFMFRLLTGKRIGFGNFMSIPNSQASRLVHYSEIWNHLAGAIIKSGIPYRTMEADRGKRYSGRSRMNFTALVLHGLGAIGVFVEVIATRLLVFSFIMILFAVIMILIIVYVKYFTKEAIPGWATNTVSSMLIVILQSFLLSLFTVFLYVSSGSQRKFIPAYHYKDYLRSIENNAHGR